MQKHVDVFTPLHKVDYYCQNDYKVHNNISDRGVLAHKGENQNHQTNKSNGGDQPERQFPQLEVAFLVVSLGVIDFFPQLVDHIAHPEDSEAVAEHADHKQVGL